MENVFKIATYNIFHGQKPKEITENVKKLKEHRVTILCLQELRQNPGEKFLLEELLQALGPNWKAEHFIKPQSHDLGLCVMWDSSVMTASGFERILLPKVRRLKLLERILENFTSKNAHPLQRGALVANFSYKDKKIRVVNVHLDWQGGLKHKNIQFSLIKEFLKNQPENYSEIVCGDFNTIGFYKFHKKRLKSLIKFVGQDFKIPTHKKSTFRYWQTLDHILVKNVSDAKAEVLKLKGSDHYPLMAEVEI